ncbi:hypothetical protein [Nocardioides lianchengensis]|uniref:Septum formation n=1 Tax=Nocardioides lianchengensis TaxID=1045774 RepID=A0A1G7B8U9_9ACTN|nr:hypothetical protein [Nocardioides lianchengensis]NYG10073.1 hypothetical protein [Nocardioides lianchengensis]SDE23277.1 hypothetical protein SAMN05421872_11774 [Nocardioides lianchengensis]
MLTLRGRRALSLLALPLLVALTSCGSDASDPRVASLPPTASTPAATTPPAGAPTGSPTGASAGQGDRRPVFRVDDSPERRATIWNAYNTCLLENGAKAPTGDGPAVALGANGEGDPGVLVDYPAPPEAQAACLQLEPVQPPALEAATNPDFHEQRQAYVQCLQDGGLWVTLLTDDQLDWTYSEGHSVPDDSAELEQTCLVQAFGAA